MIKNNSYEITITINNYKWWMVNNYKVDDTFVVTKQDPQIMLSELNNIHPQVTLLLNQW